MTTQTIKEIIENYFDNNDGYFEKSLGIIDGMYDLEDLANKLDSAISQAVKEREESLIKKIEKLEVINCYTNSSILDYNDYYIKKDIINLIKSK